MLARGAALARTWGEPTGGPRRLGMLSRYPGSWTRPGTPQVVFVGVLDFHPHHVARQRGFRRSGTPRRRFPGVGHAAANGAFFIDFIYQHQDFAPHFLLQTLGRDLLLQPA